MNVPRRQEWHFGGDRNSKREMGVVLPSINAQVEFVYRLADVGTERVLGEMTVAEINRDLRRRDAHCRPPMYDTNVAP
jgi:hypothetical protein